MLGNAIKTWLLRVALAKKAGDRIPRDGQAAERLDVYAVRLSPTPAFCQGEVIPEQGAKFLVDNLGADVLSGWVWRNEDERFLTEVDLAEALTWPVTVHHWKGAITFTFSSWREFAFHHITRIDYVHARWQVLTRKVGRYYFNRQTLVTADRVEVLRAILELQLAGRDAPTSTGVMTALYSIAWFTHPQATPQHQRLVFYLDSLADTNELVRLGTGYRITGHGIAAIELFEEQERKHHESLVTQKRMVLLTVALAGLALLQVGAAILQAGLVKLPTYRDWRNPEVIARERALSEKEPQSPNCGIGVVNMRGSPSAGAPKP